MLTLSFFIFSNSVSAATYYVAGDTGLDTNDGSISAPWKTLTKPSTTLVAGDTVYVKGGINYDKKINPSNSGTTGSPITFAAWPGTGTPIIDNPTDGYPVRVVKNYITITGFKMIAKGYKAVDFGGSTNFVLKNNTINNGSVFILVGTSVKIYNNIIFNSNVVDGISLLSSTGSEVKNNIVISSMGGINVSGGTVTADYNSYYNNTNNYTGVSAGVNDIISNPFIIDPDNNNFQLQKSSPAIGAGADLSASGVTSDILGVARPQGSGYDIGAYEYYDIPVILTTTPTTPSSNTTPTIIGNSSTISGATISSVSYSVDSGSWSSTGVTGTDSFTIVVPALADGSHTVRVRATDSYGNVSDSTLYGSTTFIVDTTAPTSNSISINSGDSYSTSTGVTLSLSSTGATQMMVSENSDFTGASWETYSTSKSFDLSSTDGTKTVYAKFKDESGNTSSSVLDSIVLDTVTPSLGSFITPRDYTKDDNKPILTFKKSTDSTSGISSYTVSLNEGKNKSYSTSGIPATGDTTKSSYLYKDDSYVKVEYFNESDSDSTNDEIRVYFKGLNENELTEGKHSWKVTVTDLAGNENSATQDFYLDKTPPGISELAIANVSTVKKGQTYTLSIFKRIPSFSGKIEDPFYGSEKTNDNGSKDTFDKVSSGIDNINLTIKKLDGKKYVNHFTKDYSVTSNRFYITTPYPLVDGQYEVLITAKDKAGNTNSYPTFYLSMGNSSIFSSVTSFVSDLFNNKEELKPDNQPSPLISPQSQINDSKNIEKQPLPKSSSFITWIISLFKSLFHK